MGDPNADADNPVLKEEQDAQVIQITWFRIFRQLMRQLAAGSFTFISDFKQVVVTLHLPTFFHKMLSIDWKRIKR